MPGFESVDDELNAIRAFHDKRAAADAAIANIGPLQASSAVMVHDFYRWLPPSVSLALASAGLGPNSDVANKVATSMLNRSQAALARVGETVTAEEMAQLQSGTLGLGDLAKRYGVNYNPDGFDASAEAARLKAKADGKGWGDVASGFGSVGSQFFGAVGSNWDDPMAKVRQATRAADAYGRAPAQMLQGTYRSFRKDVADKGLLSTLRDDVTSPRQIVVNQMRTFGQTDLGAAAAQAAQGEQVDVGDGFFINDNKGVGQQRKAFERSWSPTVTYADGSQHIATIGRDIAGELLHLEPGSRSYNILSGLGDASVMIATMKPGMAASKERQAAKGFKGIAAVAEDASTVERFRAQAGALWSPGRRMTYDANIAKSWLNGPDGQKIAQVFSETTSTRMLDRLTGNKLAPSTLRALADADTPEKVSSVLHDAISAHQLQQQVSSAPWKRMGIGIKDRLPRFANRASDLVPETRVDLSNARDTLTQADLWASTMKFSEEERNGIHDLLSSIPDEPKFYGDGLDHFRAVEHENIVQKARAQVFEGMLTRGGEKLAEPLQKYKAIIDEGAEVHGAVKVAKAAERYAEGQEKIRELMRFGFGRNDEDVRYWQDALNESSSFFGATLRDGQTIMPSRAIPSLMSETIHGTLPMPDPEKLRKAFNSPLMKAWTKIPGVEMTTVGLEALMDKWRTVNLLKPALGVRVIGDGQARILADGGDSIFSHPLRAISWMLGDSRFNESWFAKGRSNMLGDVFTREQEWAGTLNKNKRQFWQDIIYKRMEGHKVFTPAQDGFNDAWHYQLSKLHASAPGQISAGATNLDEAIGKWWDLADVREAYAKAHPASRSLPGAISGEDLLNPQGSAAFMDYIGGRVSHLTQDDPRLLKAIATGKLETSMPELVMKARDAGYPVTQVDGVETAILPLLEGLDPNPLVTEALSKEFGDVAAKFGNRGMVGRTVKITENEKNRLDQVTTSMFAALLGRPENFISKSPLGREEYWKFVRERIAYLSKDEVETVLRNAEEAKLPRDQLRTIKRLAGKAADGEDALSAEEMHHLAEAHAAQTIRDTLDDMAHRHQAFDMVKLIMPFGEAWHQVVTKWGAILSQPHVWPEMSVAMRGLRSPEAGQAIEPGNMSYDTETGQMKPRGLFYSDENGNETVTFPLSRTMMGLFGDVKQQALGGQGAANVPMTGKVKGLSVGLDVMPGLGPVASIPMAMLMDRFEDPKYDWIRDTLFPVGQPQGSTYEKLRDAFVPSWAKKIASTNAGYDDRQWSSQVIDSMRYLSSTGQYKVSGEGASQAEITRLIDDAKSQARTMAWIRGLAQTTSPTAPSFDWQITDKSGNQISALVLGRELHELQTSDDPNVRDNAILTFLQRHGEASFAILQGKSISISPSGALPPTKEARDWLSANKFMQGEYGLTYGLFAPDSPDNKFDATTYFQSLDTGDRQALDPEVALKLANRKVAQALYYSIRGQLGGTLTPEQSVTMREFRNELESRYPGYSANGDDVPGTPARATKDQVIKELERAVDDKRLADQPLTKPLKAYLELRSALVTASPSWATAKSAQAMRETMYEVGTRLSTQSAAFKNAWETVLLPEFDNALVDNQAGE